MWIVQSGWTCLMNAPRVALMMPPPMRTTSMGLASWVTSPVYGCEQGRPRDLRSAEADVGPSCRAPLLGVQRVATVYDDGRLHQCRCVHRVDRAKLGPLRDKHDDVRAGERL